jgi:hypothetical protein
MNDMKHVATVALVAVLAAPAPGRARDQAIDLRIAAGKVGEVCMPLERGDTLAWHFEASAAVAFNLHDHVGQRVDMPVRRSAVQRHRAQHTVPRRNDWCLMWTAPTATDVTVRGGWQAQRATPK